MAAYTKTASAYCGTPESEKSKIIVGRDRLNWHHADGRLFLFHGNNPNPLLSVEPDPKYTGMYRASASRMAVFSDMVNLARAKDAVPVHAAILKFVAARNAGARLAGSQKGRGGRRPWPKRKSRPAASLWTACTGSVVRRRNSISDQFSARRIEVLESPAYRALSRSAHMVI